MNLYIGNLSQQATEADVQQAFEAFGQVTSATIIKDKLSGVSHGFGFVVMPAQAEAAAAIAGLAGKQLLRQSLIVNEAYARGDNRGLAAGRGASHIPRERRMSNQWRETSTDVVERYEMSLRDARGIVIRRRADEAGYSAYVGCAGRQQWAERLFYDLQEAQSWCEHSLVSRTSN